MSMKKLKKMIVILRVCMVVFLFSVISLFLFSFTASVNVADDFLKQLGISKQAADKKITDGFLGGYLNVYGIRNATHIALGNRTAVAKHLLNYTKSYVSSPAFIKEYAQLKAGKKPVKEEIKSPEDMQKDMIRDAKKAIADNEASLKKADPQFKKIFEDLLVQSRKQLKEAEDPNNRYVVNYKKNYPNAVKQNDENYLRQLGEWEAEYPSNHLLFVKRRLETFLTETKDIDFGAELIVSGTVKKFVKREYESKSNRWKMAFRAGKEVVEPAREFVQSWIAEIK